MATYALIRYDVTDEAAYRRYRQLAGPTHVPYGGSLVAKGIETHHLEGGDHLTNFVLLEFPSPEAVKGWYASEDYLEAKVARLAAGTMTISIVEG